MCSILISRLAVSSYKPKLWKSKHIARLLYAELQLNTDTQRQRHTKLRRKPSKTIHVYVGDKLQRVLPKRPNPNKDNAKQQIQTTFDTNNQLHTYPCAKLEEFTQWRGQKNKKKNFDDKISSRLWKVADSIITATVQSKLQKIDGCELLIKLNEKLQMLELNEAAVDGKSGLAQNTFVGRAKSRTSRTVLNKAFKKGLENLMKQKRFAREKIINRFIFPDIVTQEPYCISIYPSTSFSDNEDKLFTINIVGSNDKNVDTSISGSSNATNEKKTLASDILKKETKDVEKNASSVDKFDDENIEEFDYFEVESEIAEKKQAILLTDSDELQALYQLKDIVENNLKELKSCEAKLEEVERLLDADDDEQLETMQPEDGVHEYTAAKQDLLRRSKNAMQTCMVYDEIEQQQLGEVRMAGTLRERMLSLWQYSADESESELKNFNKSNDVMQPLEVEYNDVQMEKEDLENVEKSEEIMQSKEQDENSLSEMVSEVRAIDAEEMTTEKLENLFDKETEIGATKQSEPETKLNKLEDITQRSPVDLFGIVKEADEMVMQSKNTVKLENVTFQKVDPFKITIETNEMVMQPKNALKSEDAAQQNPVNRLEMVADYNLSEMALKAEFTLNSADTTQDQNENPMKNVIENRESQLKDESSMSEIVMEAKSPKKSDEAIQQKPQNLNKNETEIVASIVIKSESEEKSDEATQVKEVNLMENNMVNARMNIKENNMITKMESLMKSDDAMQPKYVDLSEIIIKSESQVNAEKATNQKEADRMESSVDTARSKLEEHSLIKKMDSSTKSDETTLQKPLNLSDHAIEQNLENVSENNMDKARVKIDEHNLVIKMDNSKKPVSLSENTTEIGASKQNKKETSLNEMVRQPDSEVRAEQSTKLEEGNLMEINMDKTKTKIEELNTFKKRDNFIKSQENVDNLFENTMTETSASKQYPSEKVEQLQSEANNIYQSKTNEVQNKYMKKFAEVESEIKAEHAVDQKQEKTEENNVDNSKINLEKHNMVIKRDSSVKTNDATLQKTRTSENVSQISFTEVEKPLEAKEAYIKINGSINSDKTMKQKPKNLSEDITENTVTEVNAEHGVQHKQENSFSIMETKNKVEQLNLTKNLTEVSESKLDSGNSAVPSESEIKAEHTMQPELVNFTGTNMDKTITKQEELNIVNKMDDLTKSDISTQQKGMNLFKNKIEISASEQNTDNNQTDMMKKLKSEEENDIDKTDTKQKDQNLVVKLDKYIKSDETTQQNPVNVSCNVTEGSVSEMKAKQAMELKQENVSENSALKSDDTIQQKSVNLSENMKEISGSGVIAEHAMELKQENISENGSIKADDTMHQKRVGLSENITEISGSGVIAEQTMELNQENRTENNSSIKTDHTMQQKPVNISENKTQISSSEVIAERTVELKQVKLSEHDMENSKIELEDQVMVIKTESPNKPVNLFENLTKISTSNQDTVNNSSDLVTPLQTDVKAKHGKQSDNENLNKNISKLEEIKYIIELVKETDNSVKEPASEKIENTEVPQHQHVHKIRALIKSSTSEETKKQNELQTNQSTSDVVQEDEVSLKPEQNIGITIRTDEELVQEIAANRILRDADIDKIDKMLHSSEIQNTKNLTVTSLKPNQNELQARQSSTDVVQEDKVSLKSKQNTGIAIRTDEELVQEIAANRILRDADIDNIDKMLHSSEIQNTRDLTATGLKPNTMMQAPSKKQLPNKRKKVRFASTKSIEIQGGQACIPEKKKYELLEKDESIKIYGGTPCGDAPKKRKRSSLKGAISPDALSGIQLQGGSNSCQLKNADDEERPEDDGIIIEGGTNCPPKRKPVDPLSQIEIFGGSECKCPLKNKTTNFVKETKNESNNKPAGFLGRVKRFVKFFYSDGDTTTENDKSKPDK